MLLVSIISLILFSGPDKPEKELRAREPAHESSIFFRRDKSNYQDSYLGNTDAADKLLALLLEIGTENVDSVTVTAYASPEGVYEHNLMLSRKRAREFGSAVQQRIGLGEKGIAIRVVPGGEAWDLLRRRIESDPSISDTARERILKLLDDDSIPRDTKKWRMQHNYLGSTAQEGDLYHWLLLNHYRYLRCLDIRIYYHDATPSLPAEPVKEETTDVDETAGQAGSDVNVIPDSSIVIPDSDRESHPAVPEFIAQRRGTPFIGISTNLIFDATWIPNYGFTSVPSFSLEYYPARGHWTFGADLDWSHWLHYDTHRFNQIHNLTLHARRYFRTGEDGFRGLYLAGAFNAAEYGLGWDAHGWEGELLGVNAGIGHKWNWGRFFLDTGIDLGYFYSRNNPYVWGNDATGWYYYVYTGDPAEFRPRQKGFTWFGPTRAYISIGLDLFTRRK